MTVAAINSHKKTVEPFPKGENARRGCNVLSSPEGALGEEGLDNSADINSGTCNYYFLQSVRMTNKYKKSSP